MQFIREFDFLGLKIRFNDVDGFRIILMTCASKIKNNKIFADNPIFLNFFNY